ncbi:S8 family serine peptidase [Chloroflexota bacterium]
MKKKIISVIIIMALLFSNGLLFGEKPAAAADQEVRNLPPIELPEKGNPKLNSQLNQLVSAETRGEVTGFARQRNILLVDGNVRVIIECMPGQLDAATEAASALGASVETSYRDWLQVTVPISRLTALADTRIIRLVRLPWYPLPTVVSEGVGLINADGWHTAGYTGAGVKIAVLDGGFTGYSSLLGTELPGLVTIKSFREDLDIEAGTAHGTACAEIVYDIAPDAQLYLVNYGTGVEMGNAVNWLINIAEVDVISYSMGWPTGGPGDGTGPICEMVDAAHTAGILWSNAIGNSAQRHWQGNFVDTYDGDGIHEFSPDPPDEGNTIYVNEGSTITVGLKWDDPFGSSANDYDLLLFDNTGSLVHYSNNTQDGQGGDDYPFELLSYTAQYSGAYGIAICTPGIPAVVNFHLYSYYQNLEYQVASSSFAIPADSPNAMVVGAVFWDNPTEIEPFSSRGPTKDGRIKPDLVAPDGVGTASYGPSNGVDVLSGGTGFFGTSASAPAAAGAAALVKECFSSYTPAQIQTFLENRAVDLGAGGKDNLYGSGQLYLGSPGIYELTINISGNGTTAPEAGVHSYPSGTVVELLATPAEGWVFAGWSGDITDNATTTQITMDFDKEVTANFGLTVTPGSPGDANGDGVVNAVDIPNVEIIIAKLDSPTVGADATQDGKIDARDITKVEMIIAGLG